VLPLVIFLQIVDLPEADRELLHSYTRVMTHEPELAKRHEAYHGIADYLAAKIAERRANPGDDLLSKVVHAEVMGRPLTAAEMQGTANLLLFGGLDTVTSMMSFVMKFLADHPGHRRWILDNPDHIATAVEEIMRRHGVSQLMRTALVDLELDGATIQAGELVMVPSSLHGLDPREFERPEEVDFTRNGKPPATFGSGAHRCPGANLARMEMQIMVREWLRYIPDFEVDTSRPLIQRSGAVNGILELPLRWATP
jgi:cytochrome P450